MSKLSVQFPEERERTPLKGAPLWLARLTVAVVWAGAVFLALLGALVVVANWR